MNFGEPTIPDTPLQRRISFKNLLLTAVSYFRQPEAVVDLGQCDAEIIKRLGNLNLPKILQEKINSPFDEGGVGNFVKILPDPNTDPLCTTEDTTFERQLKYIQIFDSAYFAIKKRERGAQFDTILLNEVISASDDTGKHSHRTYMQKISRNGEENSNIYVITTFDQEIVKINDNSTPDICYCVAQMVIEVDEKNNQKTIHVRSNDLGFQDDPDIFRYIYKNFENMPRQVFKDSTISLKKEMQLAQVVTLSDSTRKVEYIDDNFLINLYRSSKPEKSPRFFAQNKDGKKYILKRGHGNFAVYSNVNGRTEERAMSNDEKTEFLDALEVQFPKYDFAKLR